MRSSRQLSVPPEPKPAHERWSSSESESSSPSAEAAKGFAPPAKAPPEPSVAAPVTAVTGWGGALEPAGCESDGDDGIQPFEAESEDEVMPFESSPAAPPSPHSRTSSEVARARPQPAPPAPPVGTSAAASALRTAAVITEFAAEAKGDLDLRVGEVVVLTKAPADKQWWKGYIEGDKSRKGVFPCMFVKEIGAAPRSPEQATMRTVQPFSPPAPTATAAAAEVSAPIEVTPVVIAPVAVVPTVVTAVKPVGAGVTGSKPVTVKVVAKPLGTKQPVAQADIVAPAVVQVHSNTAVCAVSPQSESPKPIKLAESNRSKSTDKVDRWMADVEKSLNLSDSESEGTSANESDSDGSEWSEATSSDSDSGSDSDNDTDQPDETEQTETEMTTATEPVADSKPVTVLKSRPVPAKTEPAGERKASPTNADEELAVEMDASEFPDVLDISSDSDLNVEVAVEAVKPTHLPVARAPVARRPTQQNKPTQLATKPVASVAAVPVKVKAVTAVAATNQRVASVTTVKVAAVSAVSASVKTEPKPTVQEEPEENAAADANLAEDVNTFQGPDPSGTVHWWTYNQSDGWCYSPTSSWIYNPQQLVYFDSSTQKYCQYSAETGIIAGTCEPDMNGLIRFVPTPKEPEVTGQPALQQSAVGNSSARGSLSASYRSSAGAGYSSAAATDPTQPVLSSLDNNLNSQGRPHRRQLDVTSLLGKTYDRPKTSHAQLGASDLY